MPGVKIQHRAAEIDEAIELARQLDSILRNLIDQEGNQGEDLGLYVPEAPIDSQIYGRKNGAWSIIGQMPSIISTFTGTENDEQIPGAKLVHDTFHEQNESIRELSQSLNNVKDRVDVLEEQGTGGSGDDTPCTYDSLLSNGMLTTATLGNIPAGTDISVLKGKNLTQLLDSILFSEVWPDTTYSHNINVGSIPELVEYGSSIQWPTITALWNSNINSDYPENISYTEYITNPNNITRTKEESLESTYNVIGDWIYTFMYRYPLGYYTLTSNYGNTRDVEVAAADSATITKTIRVTKACYINDVKQPLFAVNTQQTLTKTLGGRPVIRVPFVNSEVSIEVDLGLGFMEVDGWTVHTDDGYKVWTKNDNYAFAVPHRIKITLRP